MLLPRPTPLSPRSRSAATRARGRAQAAEQARATRQARPATAWQRLVAQMHIPRNFQVASQFCLQPLVWAKRGARAAKELRAALGRAAPCEWLTLLRRGATARNGLQRRVGHAFAYVLHALCLHGRTKRTSSLGTNTYTPWRANSA